MITALLQGMPVPQSFSDGMSFAVLTRSRLCCFVFRRRFAATLRDVSVKVFARVRDPRTHLNERGTATSDAELVQVGGATAQIVCGFGNVEKGGVGRHAATLPRKRPLAATGAALLSFSLIDSARNLSASAI
jgi:hypothetical protein